MPELRGPICQQPVDPRHKTTLPFCSLRCKQIDLRRWLGEDYGLPIESQDEEYDEYGDEP